MQAPDPASCSPHQRGLEAPFLAHVGHYKPSSRPIMAASIFASSPLSSAKNRPASSEAHFAITAAAGAAGEVWVGSHEFQQLRGGVREGEMGAAGCLLCEC